jgi:hypothetical protein
MLNAIIASNVIEHCSMKKRMGKKKKESQPEECILIY